MHLDTEKYGVLHGSFTWLNDAVYLHFHISFCCDDYRHYVVFHLCMIITCAWLLNSGNTQTRCSFVKQKSTTRSVHSSRTQRIQITHGQELFWHRSFIACSMSAYARPLKIGNRPRSSALSTEQLNNCMPFSIVYIYAITFTLKLGVYLPTCCTSLFIPGDLSLAARTIYNM